MFEVREVRTACPHANAIQFCPLYVAGHDPKLSGLTCMTGDWTECAVDREELNYEAAKERLRMAAPALVAECEFGAARDSFNRQQRRNLQNNRTH